MLFVGFLFGAEPPVLPVLGVVRCDRDVADGCVEPDVEALAFVSFSGDWDSPLEISCDASRPGFLEPGPCDGRRVVGPLSLFL